MSLLNLIKRPVSDPDSLVTGPTGGHIEFMCHEDDYGVIAEPVPAGDVPPRWFKKLGASLGPGLNKATVKKCMPFRDALSAGWIIPLGADVQFKSNEDASRIDYEWRFRRDMIGTHSSEQIAGSPLYDQPIFKFNNYWAVNVPDGYSVLFTPPLNRVEPRFQTFSGLVDCDNYKNYINFPAVWLQPSYDGVVEAGTPLVQAIPIRRDADLSASDVRAMSDEEATEVQKEQDRVNARESLYLKERWERKQ